MEEKQAESWIDKYFTGHKKLLRFVEDANDELLSINPIFEEEPLYGSTTGLASDISFLNNQIFFSEEHSDWRDILTEVYNLKKAINALHIGLGNFFRSRTNKELEELYGLGIEPEEVSDGAQRRTEEVHTKESTEVGEQEGS